MTRDPLDWLQDRATPCPTSNGDSDDLELAAYVTLGDVQRRLSVAEGDLVAAIGPLCETVVLGAINCQGVVLAGTPPSLPSAKRFRAF